MNICRGQVTEIVLSCVLFDSELLYVLILCCFTQNHAKIHKFVFFVAIFVFLNAFSITLLWLSFIFVQIFVFKAIWNNLTVNTAVKYFLTLSYCCCYWFKVASLFERVFSVKISSKFNFVQFDMYFRCGVLLFSIVFLNV